MWYRYLPASNVPLRELCAESLCDMSLARNFGAISDENFGRTKKLNPYYYCLNDGLSHGIGIGRLAAFPFEKNVPKSGVHQRRLEIMF